MTTAESEPPMMHVALLRGINVGGGRKVAMADLRATVEAAGFGKVQTLIASGNLVLESPELTGSALEAKLESEAKARLGLDTPFLVRSATEWDGLIAGNPLRGRADAEPSRFAVLVTRNDPSAGAVDALRQVAAEGEEIRAGARCLYIAFPNGMGRSKLGQAISGAKLGPATARNWNTVVKLAAMMA
jgi:uncharacterized protein (DUF1697 family)